MFKPKSMVPAAICFFVAVAPNLSVGADKPSEAQDLDKLSLGVSVVSLSDVQSILKKNGIKISRRTGVFVTDVVRYGPAYDSRIRRYDIIVRIGKKPVRNVDDLRAAVSELKADTVYDVKVYRRVRLRSRRYTWRNGEFSVKPATRRQIYLASMRIKEDKIKGVSFYKHRGSPTAVNSKSDIHAYFPVKDGKPGTLRIIVQFVAKDWLFIRKYTIKAGKKTFSFSPKNIERDNSARAVWEWCDVPATPTHMSMLKAIVSADSVLLRCEGDQYKKDRTITEDEKERLKTVLTVHGILGGK